MTGKHTINLLQAELLPEVPFWSLSRVVALWGLALILMLVWVFISQFQLQQLQSEKALLRATQQEQQTRLSQLETELAAKKPDPALISRLEILKLVMVNKQGLHAQLTDTTRASVAGFASAMTELSQLHHRGISLHRVNISNDDMTFSGLAKVPEAVPEWLAGFEDSQLLSGKSFINFKLQENEDKLTEFVVSSKYDAEAE